MTDTDESYVPVTSEEARFQKSCTIWFQLYDILEKAYYV